MKHAFSKFSVFLVPMLVMTGLAGAQPAQPNGMSAITNLTLQQALDMAERLHPKLAEAHAAIDAAKARLEQAGAFPNPEAILRAEQISTDGNGEEEYAAGISQPIPLSNRREKARQAAELEREVRMRGLEVVRRNLHGQVQNAFATALYQDSAYRAWKEISDSAAGMVHTARARVEAGESIASEAARAEMELARTVLELERVKAMHRQAVLALAGAIGDADLRINSLEGSLEIAFDFPALETIVQDPASFPDVAMAESQLRAAEAQVNLAAAQRIPDVNVEALYHRLEGSEANTIDFGLSIPLPIFSTQRGRLREAQAESYAAEAHARTVRIETRFRLEEAGSRLKTSLDAAKALKSRILPQSESVLRSGELRYEAGDMSLADLLPMRRDHHTTRLAYLETLRAVMQAWADVARIAEMRK